MGECYEPFFAFGCSAMELAEKFKQLGMVLKGNQGDSDLEERNDQESHLEKEDKIENEIEFLQEQLEQTETQFRRYSDFDLKKYGYLEK